MKLIVEIDDHKAASFMELIKDLGYIKARPVSIRDAESLKEINEIKKVVEDADKKLGKAKNNPANRLPDSLEAATYKQKLTTVSTWTEDDLKAFEEVRKDFGDWKSEQW